MAKNHYTFLIVPKKKSSVKKITASSTLVKSVSGGLVIFILCIGFFLFDYAVTKKQDYELYRLKQLTVNQKEQIKNLATKVSSFEKKMENLEQLDQKIRSMTKTERKQFSSQGQLLGIGGFDNKDSDNTAVSRIEKNLDRLIQNAADKERSFTDLLAILKKRESILAVTPSIWPVHGWVTSEFGYRSSPYDKDRELHRGMDIASRLGNEVRSPADGIVAEVVNRPDMGNYVVIDHLKGISTGYAHLLRAAVVPGKSIKRGDIIGYVGNSGRSTGSHLHYCVYLNGIPVNPRKYLN